MSEFDLNVFWQNSTFDTDTFPSRLRLLWVLKLNVGTKKQYSIVRIILDIYFICQHRASAGEKHGSISESALDIERSSWTNTYTVGSEYQTWLVFKWSIVVSFSNGSEFRWSTENKCFWVLGALSNGERT